MEPTPEFDTRGVVKVPYTSDPDSAYVWRWTALSPFVRCYLVGMFNLDGHFPFVLDGQQWIGPSYKFADLAPETLAKVHVDCQDFIAGAGGKSWALDGACFWNNRQAGIYPGFPPLVIEIGKDGLVRFQ